jgi:hypothetical protein
MISRRKARRLATLTTRYMAALGELLASCKSEMDPDDWEGLGQALGVVWTTVGDNLLYPIGDAYRDLVAQHKLPARPGLQRRWGPLRAAARMPKLSGRSANDGSTGTKGVAASRRKGRARQT